MESNITGFFEDYFRLFIERALEARDRKQGAGIGAENEEFETGRALAYYEMVANFINMAEIFGIPSQAFSGLTFDPDKELL